jgi:hypothetical protein
MAQRVVLHIGLMKSGTTFLQGRMNANREKLDEQQVLFPGPTWARHVRGVSDFMGSRKAEEGAWASLRDEINAYDGTAVVSMEYLAALGPAKVKLLPDEFPGTDLRVVVTVRDLGRSVPAMWQETIKNRATWEWDEYVRSIRMGGRAGRNFWKQQDSGKIVRRWADGVGPGSVYVITVPPPGAPSEQLWDRFCEVAGIGPDTWAEAPRANESLGTASTLVLRLLNQQTQELTLPQYKKRVKALGKYVMSERRREEDPIGFTVPGWLRRRAEKARKEIAESGVHLIGGLDELDPVNVPGVHAGKVSAEAQRDAAVAALAGTLQQVRKIVRSDGQSPA